MSFSKTSAPTSTPRSTIYADDSKQTSTDNLSSILNVSDVLRTTNLTPTYATCPLSNRDVSPYASTNSRSSPNPTMALFKAASEGNLSVIENALKDSSFDLNETDGNGRTLLLVASAAGRFSIVEALIEAKVELDKSDPNGNTPLWKSVLNGHFDITKLLLDAGADKDKADITKGLTPIHLAVEMEAYRTVKLLIERGADLNRPDKEGLTPLDTALRINNTAVLELLKRHSD